MEMKRKRKGKRELIPPWRMPSDPVKALFWFMQWLLIVLVRFFWIPIIGMMVYETVISSKVGGFASELVSGVITCLVGLSVWGVLYLLLALSRIGTTVSRTLNDVNRMQQTFTQRGRSPFPPFSEPEPPEKVVEGTITDLDEERKKRRRE